MNILIVHAGAESIAAALERAGQLFCWKYARVTCEQLIESSDSGHLPLSMTLDSASAVVVLSTDPQFHPDRLCGLSTRLRCPPFCIATPILVVFKAGSACRAKSEWLAAQNIHIVHDLYELPSSLVRIGEGSPTLTHPLHDLASRPLWAVQLELPGHDYRNKIKRLHQMPEVKADDIAKKMLEDAFRLLVPYLN